MWVRLSSDKQQQHDPEWLIQLERSLHKNGNREKFEEVKKIFYETYLESIQEGMKSEEALQKAKMVAFCFLMLQ